MRIFIGGVQSGVGKTTIVAGLIAVLHRSGLAVQPFKVGPDYIDPTYHTLAAGGRPCRNLDSWMVPEERLKALFTHYSQMADISVAEGVMGLFDGRGYQQDTDSTAHIAKLTRSPVVLVLDASKMARSAAAIALGFQHFDPDLRIAGFIVNNVGSENHGKGVAAAIQQATGLPVLGWIPRDPALRIPERHLGLVPTAEPGRWLEFISTAAERVSRYVHIDRLLAIAQDVPPQPAGDFLANLQMEFSPESTRKPVIAVARDEAFNFIYEENLELLRAAGARVVFFSPLNDEALPAGSCGVILSGGFPEFYAEKLAANDGMRQALQNAHAQGLPIYAECGGLMVLTESITDLQGREFPMFALLPGRSVMTSKLAMGYRLAFAASDSWLMNRGEEMRGHEFHYSRWEDRPSDLPPAYSLLPANGQGEARWEGITSGSLWASYVHLHFWARPELAQRFVTRCLEWSSTPHAPP